MKKGHATSLAGRKNQGLRLQRPGKESPRTGKRAAKKSAKRSARRSSRR